MFPDNSAHGLVVERNNQVHAKSGGIADVRWSEADVGTHSGCLQGRDAVLGMIRRALDATGGSFELAVTRTVETGSHVAALIA